MRPKHELAHIIHRYGKAFLKHHPQSQHKLRTLNAIAQCRTAALGGHTCKCDKCQHKRHFYNSCRNRHCPKCQTVNKQRWILQREAELLPVAYYHIVFTLPHELNPIAVNHPKEVYGSLFAAGWDTIKTFANDHKFLGAKTGMVAILHTWGQQLWLHPHIHCIVPGGGITPEGKWKHAKYKDKYLFPKRAMSLVFRAKFMAKLRSLGVTIPQQIAKALFSKKWVVYAKRPFASPKTVVEYLGRYTHKIAISNHRLISISGDKVQFNFKDYKSGGKKSIAQLSATEFLRRFSYHILPHGFVRIRHYGILASRNKAVQLNIAKTDLGQHPWHKIVVDWKTIAQQTLKLNPDQCPVCKNGTLVLVSIIQPLRGPPLFANYRRLKSTCS